LVEPVILIQSVVELKISLKQLNSQEENVFIHLSVILR